MLPEAARCHRAGSTAGLHGDLIMKHWIDKDVTKLALLIHNDLKPATDAGTGQCDFCKGVTSGLHPPLR